MAGLCRPREQCVCSRPPPSTRHRCGQRRTRRGRRRPRPQQRLRRRDRDRLHRWVGPVRAQRRRRPDRSDGIPADHHLDRLLAHEGERRERPPDDAPSGRAGAARLPVRHVLRNGHRHRLLGEHRRRHVCGRQHHPRQLPGLRRAHLHARERDHRLEPADHRRHPRRRHDLTDELLDDARRERLRRSEHRHRGDDPQQRPGRGNDRLHQGAGHVLAGQSTGRAARSTPADVHLEPGELRNGDDVHDRRGIRFGRLEAQREPAPSTSPATSRSPTTTRSTSSAT